MSAYDHLELLATSKAQENALPHVEAYLLSIAISLKRLADQSITSGSALDKLAGVVDQNSYPYALRTKSG